MKKISIFLSDLDGGGAERVMLNLAQGFADHNFAVDMVLARREGPYLSQIPDNVKLVDLKAKSLLCSLHDLSRYLKQEQPIALISALEDTNIVALWAKLLARVEIPVIVTVHNNLSQESENATNLKRKLVPFFIPWCYRWADAVIAVSHGVAEDLVKIGVLKKQITVIYNPIVTPELIEKIQQPLEHPWFSQEQPPVILGVGRLTKQKDFSTLIQAFAQVKQHQSARLIILGEGEERPHLESLIQKLSLSKDVALLGFVSNPYAYMKRASLLVLSSAWEGFGNVLVEAMAAGTPVISTNCKSGPAEILADGQYGQLVQVGDSDEMAKAIIESLINPLDSTLLRNRSLEFSLERSIVEYQKILIQ